MEKAKVFTRLIQTNSPLGDFHIKVELERTDDEGNTEVHVSSYNDLKDAEPIFVVSCTPELNDILKTVQEVSESHTHHLMELEREDTTKFFINRGFKPEYPRFSV